MKQVSRQGPHSFVSEIGLVALLVPVSRNIAIDGVG